MNFRISLSNCTKSLDSDRDCIDSVGYFETGTLLCPSQVSHLIFTKAPGSRSYLSTLYR